MCRKNIKLFLQNGWLKFFFVFLFWNAAPIVVGIKSKAGVNGPKEKEIPVQIKDNKDGTYAATYTPENPGEYAVAVKYGGTEIPMSPLKVGVVPDVDVSKIQIADLQDSK